MNEEAGENFDRAVGWGPCPHLEIHPSNSPFDLTTWRAGNPTSQFVIAVMLAQSEVETLDELNLQLAVVEELFRAGLVEAKKAGAHVQVQGLTVRPDQDTGLAFFIALGSKSHPEYSMHQLFAALSLWLQCEGWKTIAEEGLIEGISLLVQSTLSFAFSIGEGAIKINDLIVSARQSKNRTQNAAYKQQSTRKSECKERFLLGLRQGEWKTKVEAFKFLTDQFHFSPRTLEKWFAEYDIRGENPDLESIG